MTVDELRALLEGLPGELPVGSCGPDCGGYDYEDGENVMTAVTPLHFWIWHQDVSRPVNGTAGYLVGNDSPSDEDRTLARVTFSTERSLS